MNNLLYVKYEDHKFVVYSNTDVFGWIAFEQNNIDADISVGGRVLKAVQGEDKNMVLKEGGKALFTFKFDYLWGGAELISDGVETGYDIKGRWFKPGTRLTNDNDVDLVVAVKKGNGLEVSVTDTEISPVMVMATIFYHIYASAGKLRSVLIAVS